MGIDLSVLPEPQVVESLDYDNVVSRIKERYLALMPESYELLDSDPAAKVLEAAAYEIVLLRQRVNESVKAVMLAFAQGSDLDHLASIYGLGRHEGEMDKDFRQRVQSSLERLTTAGTRQSYESHALNAHESIVDAYAHSPEAGKVEVVVLGGGSGSVEESIVDVISKQLNDEKIRPLSDIVSVVSAQPEALIVEAILNVKSGAKLEIQAKAKESLTRYIGNRFGLGKGMPLSGIMSALHVSGVDSVTLTHPAQDTAIDPTHFIQVTGIKVELADG